MDQAERDSWADYCRDLATRMGLGDWQVWFRLGEPADGALASVRLPYGRRVLEITVGGAFLNEDPEGQRDTLVHEILHGHFEPALALASEFLEAAPLRAFTRELEYGLDGVGHAWARSLPLRIVLSPAPPRVRRPRGGR